MSSSSMKFAAVVFFALALLSIAAPTPATRRDGEAGIPGWQPIYGVGPVIPSKAIESDAPGFPGWQSIYGRGPVVTSRPHESGVDASAPRPTKYAIDYLPTWANHAQGSSDDSSPAPTTTARKPNPSKYAIDYLPGYPRSSSTATEDAANIPKPTKSSKYAVDYMPTWAIPAPKETSA